MIGQTTSCYTGSSGTLGFGLCQAGTATCAATPNGNAYGACLGEVVDQPLDSCVVAGDEDCDNTIEACSGSYVWAKPFGNAAANSGTNVSEASDGSIFAVVSLTGSLTVNNTVTSDGMGDVGLIKLDAAGSGVGIHAYGGVGADTPGGLAAVSDGVVLSMYLDATSSETFGGPAAISSVGGDAVVVKLDNDFNFVWSKVIGGAGQDRSLAVARMPDNGVVVIGTFASSSINLGGSTFVNAGVQDVYVLRLDANGNHVWSRSFGSSAWDEVTSLAVTPAGDVVFSGASQGSLNFGGGPLTNLGGYDAFVAKLAFADGSTQWAHALKSAADEYGPTLVAQSSGAIWAAGGMSAAINVDDLGGTDVSPVGAGTDVYVLKYSAAGAFQSASVFNGTSMLPLFPRATRAADDSFVVGGSFQDTLSFGTTLTTAGGYDMFLAKFDPAGSVQWSKRLGGTTNDIGNAFATAADLDVLLVGSYETALVNFGGGNLPNAGLSDMVVARYRQ